jgi:predicted dehydrogenase
MFYGPSPAELLADSFVAAIKTGKPLPIDLDDVAEVFSVLEAAYASADAGQPQANANIWIRHVVLHARA